MADNIFDLLGFSNLDFGAIQNVDEMTIVPILGKDLTKKTSDPEKVTFNRTRGYGSMVFHNEDSHGYGIVPNNTMVISEQAAQDHAMADTGVLASKETHTFDNACCIQQSQCGYIDSDKNQYNVLPVDLRRALLNPTKRKQHEFGKLWNDISKFLQGVPGVAGRGGHLEYFFRPFQKELEDFVAEFEPVKDQLGAFIFFNDNPVGIEIMPNGKHWETYWKWLIRGCYGAQLLQLKKSGKLTSSKITFPALNSGDIIDKMRDFLGSVRTNFINSMNTLSIKSTVKVENPLPSITKKLIKIGSGGGDLLMENDKPVYLSSVI